MKDVTIDVLNTAQIYMCKPLQAAAAAQQQQPVVATSPRAAPTAQAVAASSLSFSVLNTAVVAVLKRCFSEVRGPGHWPTVPLDLVAWASQRFALSAWGPHFTGMASISAPANMYDGSDAHRAVRSINNHLGTIFPNYWIGFKRFMKHKINKKRFDMMVEESFRGRDATLHNDMILAVMNEAYASAVGTTVAAAGSVGGSGLAPGAPQRMLLQRR